MSKSLFKKLFLRQATLFLADALIVASAYAGAFWVRMDLVGQFNQEWWKESTFLQGLMSLLIIRLLCGLLIRQHTWSFRHASLAEAMALVKAAVVGSLIFIGLTRWGQIVTPTPPRSVYLIEFLLS